MAGFFKPLPITSIEYYEEQEEQSRNEAEALAPGKPNRHAGRDEVAYYQDNGAGESKGVWWTRSNGQPLRSGYNPSSSLPPSSVFGTDGETVNGRHLRDLAIGRHPDTKEPLAGVGPKDKRRVGFDITASAPKSVSVYAAASDEATRVRIFDAHDRATRRMMDYADSAGLIITRQSGRDETTGKKVYFGVPVEETSAAVYRHFTSRALDPQLHSHVVLLNVAKRPDGSTGAINDSLLNLHQGHMAAIYRTELASILRDELGLECVRDGRNFEIAGISEKVIDTFSKRRSEIEKVAAEKGFNTALDRRKAEIAALDTRSDKDKDVGLSELEEIWDAELRRVGWDRNSLMQSAQAAAREVRREVAKGPSRAEVVENLIREAIAETLEHDSVAEARVVERKVLEALQTTCTTDESLAALERLVASGALVHVGEKGKRPLYSTAEIIATERAMLQAVRDRKGERQFFSPRLIEAAIAKKEGIRQDQIRAVRHALNDDGVAVVEGSAGSGKSYSLEVVADVARASGFDYHPIAPSWKAADVLGEETKARDMAKAAQGWINKVEKGEIVLNRKSVVVCDEAGMVGLEEMARIVRACSEAGAKLVLVGDTSQLQPVTRGSPMAAIMRACGSERIVEIVRQNANWQRAATKLFAEGKAKEAMEAYLTADAVSFGDDRAATIAKLVEDYAASRADPARQFDEKGRPVLRAILTSWNEDVREINRQVRAAGKAAGWIEADDWTMKVIPRGAEKATELGFAVGDDVIFGETVEVGATMIRNADLARIERIHGDKDDPTLVLRLVKGATIEAKASALVGRREEGQPAVPRMQHACAMTTHASQGVTVHEAYVANLRGMGWQQSYVAMSRHRERVHMYVDGGRIAEKLGTEELVIRESRDRGAAMAETEDDKGPLKVDPADIRKALLKEVVVSDNKANASDFMEMDAFLRADAAPEPEPVRPVLPAAAKLREALAPVALAPRETPSLVTPGTPRPVPRPGSSGFGNELYKRMQERLNAPSSLPVPERPKVAQAAKGNDPRPPLKGRITDAEMAQMKDTNLLSYALDRLGGQQTEEDRRATREHFGKVRFGDDVVSITKKPSGWMWTLSRGGSKAEGTAGSIWNLVAWRDRIRPGDAMHKLREELRTFVPNAIERATAVPRDVAQDRNKLANARHNWTRYPQEPSRYLVAERGIRPETLARLAGDVKSDWTGDRASNRYGAVFVHRDADGEVASYCRRGAAPKGQIKSFRGFAEGVTQTLFQGGDRKSPERIVITESSIDTVSLWQRDGHPDRTLLLAPDGTPGRRSLETIEALARKHPGAAWEIGMDNDEAGSGFAEKVRSAIRKGNEKAKVEERKPDGQFKDWNAEVRGLTREQEAAEKERRRQEVEAEARKVREREEQERRRREEEEARHTMRGPRF